MDASKKNNKKSIESSGLDPPLNYALVISDESDDENQTKQNPIDDYEPEPSDMSEFEVVKYETKIVSPRNDMPNWIREMLDSAIVFTDVPKLEHMAMLFTLSRKGNNKIKFDDPLWSPSPEQIRIL
ncbi:hypothetical protein MKW92_049390 [Papaver armeniacum]|nr:hypothetical protein MKW92_049390 [Papaver armeniacum]